MYLFLLGLTVGFGFYTFALTGYFAQNGYGCSAADLSSQKINLFFIYENGIEELHVGPPASVPEVSVVVPVQTSYRKVTSIESSLTVNPYFLAISWNFGEPKAFMGSR